MPLETNRVKPLTGLHPNGRLPALPANIRLRWKLLALANAQAYYNTATNTVVKYFIVQAPSVKFTSLYFLFYYE
jgi:hypothetical protein